MKTVKIVSLLFFFGLFLTTSVDAQIIDSLPWFKDPNLHQFMQKYIRALERGNSRVITQSIQPPTANQGWDEGVAAIIARKSKQQLKVLRLDKSPENWSFKSLKRGNKKRSRVAILIPTNKTKPTLETASSVMTHPYFAKEKVSTRGLVFEVEVTIVDKDIRNPKIVIEGHSDPLRKGNR